jgi:hypothetical protein
LDECLRLHLRPWRSLALAIQLAARRGLGQTDETHLIASALGSTFDAPGEWFDWPATVYAQYLERFGLPGAASQFAAHYVGKLRRELYPPPITLTELANALSAEATSAT